MSRRTIPRASLYGEMADTITATLFWVRSLATNPILKTFVSLSAREKPRPFDRFVRTISPSKTSTLPMRFLSSFSTISLTVVLPAPERPVNHSVNPRLSFVPFCMLPLLCPVLLFVYSRLLDDLLFIPQAFYEDLDDLGAAELRRRVLPPAEHLPNPRAGEEDVRILAVWAGLGGRHPLAVQTEKGVLEEERRDVELLLGEHLEDVLGVVGAVVVADAGVVAPDDEVGAAVVLAAH